MSNEFTESRRFGFGRLWWFVAVPLIITILGGLAVEYLKPQQAPSIPPSDDPRPDAGRTLAYWRSIDSTQERAIQGYQVGGKSTFEDVNKLLEESAESLEELPAVGVDLDAVGVAHDMARMNRVLGRYLKRHGKSHNLALALSRALTRESSDDPRQAQDARELFEAVERAAVNARRSRSVLSAQYGREFPALTSAPKELPGVPEPVQLPRLVDALSQPSPEFMLMKLKRLGQELETSRDQSVRELAQATVEKEGLQTEIDILQARLRAEVAAKRDPRSLEQMSNVLKAKEKELKFQEEMIEALTARIDAISTEQRRLNEEYASLEIELQRIRRVEPEVNKGQLEELKEKLRQLDVRLNREREELRLRSLGQPEIERSIEPLPDDCSPLDAEGSKQATRPPNKSTANQP